MEAKKWDFEVFDAVNTSVISGPINPMQFQTATYSVLPTAGSTYDWTFLGGTIQSGAGSNAIDIVWNSVGGFTLSVIETDVNGCVGEEETIIVYKNDDPEILAFYFGEKHNLDLEERK